MDPNDAAKGIKSSLAERMEPISLGSSHWNTAIKRVMLFGVTGISKTISAWPMPASGLVSGSPAIITAKGLRPALAHSSPLIELFNPGSACQGFKPVMVISLFHQTKKEITKTSAIEPISIKILFRLSFTLVLGAWGKNGPNGQQASGVG